MEARKWYFVYLYNIRIKSIQTVLVYFGTDAINIFLKTSVEKM
jgi:hypothetical protein